MDNLNVNPKQKKARKKRENDPIEESQVNTSYLLTFLLIIASILIYDVVICTSKRETKTLESLKTDLVNSVHNQSEAVHVILESVTQFYNRENHLSVVNFVGSTGVGKTFTANLLKKHFSSFEFRENFDKVLQVISKSDNNLVIFDDLNLRKVPEILKVLRQVPKDFSVFVICIFNIQETDNFLEHTINYEIISEISDQFHKAQVLYKMARFREFTAEDVKTWLLRQVESKGFDAQLYLKNIEFLLSHQNVKYHGLKGLNSKLNLEL